MGLQAGERMKILVVEDDPEAGRYLVRALGEAGHVTDLAGDGDLGLEMALAGSYDVLVIDRMLPKRDGLSLIMALRSEKRTTPALILSALGQVDDRVLGLRAGGDDYLTKPYAFTECLARVEALARRQNPQTTQLSYKVADLELDRLAHRVVRDHLRDAVLADCAIPRPALARVPPFHGTTGAQGIIPG